MSAWSCKVCGFGERYTLPDGEIGGCKQCARNRAKSFRETPERIAKREAGRAERGRKKAELLLLACSRCGAVPVECKSLCKSCYQKDQYAADRAPYSARSYLGRQKPGARDRQREYRKGRRITEMLSGAKKRAKEVGVPFAITAKDLVIPTHCPVLGMPLEHSNGCPGRASPSLDRIIPELGYVPGSIQIISMKANTMKQDANPEELALFAKWALALTLPERVLG